MAWETPLTVTAETLTAAYMNVMLRNNMNELAPAHATTPGSYFVSTQDINGLAERRMYQTDRGGAFTTASLSWIEDDDWPGLTFEHGGAFLALYSARVQSTSGTVSTSPGTDESPPLARYSIRTESGATNLVRTTCHRWFTGQTPGETTLRMYYYSSTGGTGSFGQRELIVFPF